MVVVEHASGTFQVEVVAGIFVPRQVYQRLQIGKLYAVFGALWVEHIQLVQLLIKHFCCLLAPFALAGLFFQLFAFGRASRSAQLFLNVLNLLLQEVFALLLVKVFARFRAYRLSQFQQFALAVNHAQCHQHAFLHVVGFDKFYLIGHAEVHHRADIVGHHNVVVQIVD